MRHVPMILGVAATACHALTTVSVALDARPNQCSVPRCRVHASAADEATERLTQWVTSSGGDVSRISIREDLDGIRGVAIGDGKISPLETEFMVVPAALALSDDLDELLERSPLAAKAGRASLNLLQPDAHLALRLLHEKSLGDESPWADYISLLPSHVHVARHITDEAALASRSDFLLKQSMLARNYPESVASTLLRLVGGGEEGEGTKSLGFTVEELGWALDLVHSRSFSVDAGARGLRRFMVPLIDSASSIAAAEDRRPLVHTRSHARAWWHTHAASSLTLHVASLRSA